MVDDRGERTAVSLQERVLQVHLRDDLIQRYRARAEEEIILEVKILYEVRVYLYDPILFYVLCQLLLVFIAHELPERPAPHRLRVVVLTKILLGVNYVIAHSSIF
jgi:hypothetical protein